jgi:DNA ligase-1
MSKREFVELAHEFDPKKHNPAMWYMSTKLDGHRAFWDGGLTRGMFARDVPWANTAKDDRYITLPRATGLWSRGGKVIHAPTWFLDALPKGVLLDGELWAGRGKFQRTSSIVKQLMPDSRDWKEIKYMVFDSPSWHAFAESGDINTPNFQKRIQYEVVSAFVELHSGKKIQPRCWTYDIALGEIPRNSEQNCWGILPQVKLPMSRKNALETIEAALEQCTKDGDEGLMLRNPVTPWEPKRSWNLLKVKKRHDAEATVVGYTWGKKTDKGSKLLGLMGALVVQMPNGKVFELSGFKDEERRMLPNKYIPEGEEFNPLEGHIFAGQKVIHFHNPKFPIGSKVTYSYRELTDIGIPKEAQYLRKAHD